MAPQALPTVTARAAGASTTLSTVAPMTTIWTPPASCASQIPTAFIGGTCNSAGCTAYNANQIATATWDAWLSFAYITTGNVQLSTACAPPSTQVGDFWYSPAIGCPIGYNTASMTSDYYSRGTSVFCCPSAYSSLASLNGEGLYGCWRYVSVAETMSLVAWGDILSSGYNILTISPISTTIIQPTRADGTKPWVWASPVQIVISVSASSTTPTTTAFSGYSVSTNPSISFHIGPLSSLYSILIIVAAGILCLTVLCCCCYCCRSKRPPTPSFVDTRDHEPAVAPTSVTTQICPHDISDSCRSTTSNPCCACADKRSGKMSRETRVQPYCIFCSLFWKAVPIGMCPPEWELLGPRCEHNKNGSCEGEQESNSCCGCFDKRDEFLDLDLRVSNYCPPCRRLWELKKPNAWPALWGHPPVQSIIPSKSLQGRRSVASNASKPQIARKPAPTRTAKKDKKALSKSIELSILSQVSKNTPEPDVTEIKEGEETDELRYGAPKLLVSPNILNSPVASQDSVSKVSSNLHVQAAGQTTPPWEAQGRKKKHGLLYSAPRFAVPEDPSAS